MHNLKPCPFCGEAAELTEEEDHHGAYFALGCSKEGCIAHYMCYTYPAHELPNVARQWNNRPLEGLPISIQEALNSGDGTYRP